MAVASRRFTGSGKFNLGTTYRRVETIPGRGNPSDDLDYTDCSFNWTNGSGINRADIQHHSRRQLINSTELIDLDGGLTNEFGDTLDFDAVKLLIIRNRQTEQNRWLEVRFKDERYYIGAQGFRVVVEPGSVGLAAIVSSASSEEGQMTVSSNADITYDLILIGSVQETSE